MEDKLVLVIDYETRSRADLKLCGPYEYARDLSTRIMCAAWRFERRSKLREARTRVWTPASHDPVPPELVHALARRDVTLVAHNALFEQVITRFVLSRLSSRVKTPGPERWYCTAATAAAHALPRNLADACSALGLPAQKDLEGRRVMLKLSKPRKPTKNNPSPWHNSRADLERVMQYCADDIAAEVELYLALDPLNETERRVWELDQRTNLRGVAVDRPLVLNTLNLVKEELAGFEHEIREITGGAVGSSNEVANIKTFLAQAGVELPNLQAKTVADKLAEPDLDPTARRVLEIRQGAGKTSTAKFAAIEARSRADGRVRDLLMYHGASTGRWTGTGIQIQNFPRGNGRDSILACELLQGADLDLVKMLYGDALGIFSTMLRSTLCASPGHLIYCGDFNAIEVRVLFWLAGHREGLRSYEQDLDLYREMATHLYGVPLARVTDAMREIGKRIILGAGYGMGADTFLRTCKLFGVDIDRKLAQRAIKIYREVHEPVKELWYATEKAAISAVSQEGKTFTAGRCKWKVADKFLWCELPSGRRLAYYGPKIKYEAKPWGEHGPTLYHWGVHPKTKKWVFDSTYGGRLVENLTQSAARDVMAEASLRLDAAGYPLLFSVHDELVNESPDGDLAEYTRIMSEQPQWADGLPLKVKTFAKERYRK